MDPEARKVIELGYGGSERLTMNMGPQHPSAHGVFRAILILEGETVVGVDAVIGYLHRCHEKLGESLTYTQYPSIASKTDYVAAMTSELAYVRAAEMVGKVEVPRRAQYLRVIMAELQRIASHCLWLGTWCLDMGGALGGGATVFLYCIREREWVLDLFEALVGARLLYGFHQVGGTRYDIPAGWAQKCRETIGLIERRLDEYEDMLERNAFFLARTQGVGVISRNLAQTVGVSGPLIRAPGSATTFAGSSPTPPTRISTSRCRWRPPGTATRATGCGWWSSASRSTSCGRRWTACPRARCPRDPASSRWGRCGSPRAKATRASKAPAARWAATWSPTAAPSPTA
jgi:Ni,Fe-hydrogenase III large subunit